MGASRWIYFTDKNTDPQAALDELREQVFEQSWRHREPSLQTLSDLMDSGILEEEGGTHSIIDVDRMIVTADIDAEEDGTVRLVTPQEIIEYFGAAKPTRDDIERAYKTSASDIPPTFRGSGCCAPVYDENGNAAGLVFWGMTGD
ncbi:hypothetical protein [Streptomyces sp. TRM68367]|uniref:hypothetical protein n=1 Tax=Streptomyces sp. TRM68367 TaxID=2758415 RepID=UPI00165BD6E7|nr:hypothetical protein [Streptomyces sp. TRM68367]MBC9731574.1 hypothetical protein [Streptomyces sp. TRM68367]